MQANQYCNMAWIDPSLLTKVAYASPFSKRIKFAGDQSSIAVGVMPVSIEECKILDPAMIGYTDLYSIRRLIGLPFTQIWESDLNLWGKILGFDTLPAPVSPTGISFQSQGKEKGL